MSATLSPPLPPQRPPYTGRQDEYTAWLTWETSPLQQAARPSLTQIAHMTKEGIFFANITSPQGQVLWSYANAPITTVTDEHSPPLFQKLVYYSAPIIHPRSGILHGALNLGMSDEQHFPLGQITITALAHGIAQQLPLYMPQAELEIHALGHPLVLFRGKSLHLTPRMSEILCLLALNQDGLTLEACHAALYGDEQVTTTTLKAELSHLRTLLDGRISSRIYRLLGTVWVDFIEVWALLRQHRTDEAQQLYRGELLPNSQSPEIREWRTCLNAVMHQSRTARFA